MSIVLLPKEKWFCRCCGRRKPDTEHFWGKQMWHHVQPTCRCEEFFICNKCYPTKIGRDSYCCNACGNEEIYT